MVKRTHYLYFFMLGSLLALSACTSTRETSSDKREAGPGKDYLKALLRFEPWAESVWHDYSGIPRSGYFGDGEGHGNGGIRGTCGIALAYAVLVNAYPHDPRNKLRLKRIEEALRYAERTHESGPDSAIDGRKWGVLPSFPANYRPGWQSSMWAASMGFAASLVENKIDPQVVKGCKRVVAAEATWLSKIPPRSGYKRNTAAEENGWRSNILALAAAWMHDDPKGDEWLRAAKMYAVNTYTVPSDKNGPLKKWIETQTLFPSYALENHGFYHPVYQLVSGMSLGDSYVMAWMNNKKVAKELEPFTEHNVKAVWKFLQRLVLDSGEIAYPSGMDWSLHDYEHISYLAWLASHFKDPVAFWAESRLAGQVLYRQAVNKDGRFVGESCPDGFYREAVEARRVAMAYLMNAIAGFPKGEGRPPENFLAHYDDVGLIIQRSDNALTTVSYGPRTMALVYPLKGQNAAQRFLVSPNTSTLIGGKGKTALKEYEKTAAGFRAELRLNSGKGRKSRMIIESTPDAVVFIEIPLAGSKLPARGWLLNAIENDPLTGNKRTVLWDGHSEIIRGRSGRSIPPFSADWINIDNWMGYVIVPDGGTLSYRTANKYNRNGAAEDYLYYKPKLLNAPRAVIVLPGENATGTAEVRKSVRWDVSAGECTLTFRSPDGEKMKITVNL